MAGLEADHELEEVRREIIESRGLLIKTNNLANSLAADIKAIAKRQAGYERQFTWNSATAYVLFAVLTFVGLKLASDARIREVEHDKESLARQLTAVKAELGEETQRAEERRRAAAAAEAFYTLLERKERELALTRFAGLPMGQLSDVERRVFRERVATFRSELAFEAYLRGLELKRGRRYEDALAAFDRALELDPKAAHLGRLQLARARTFLDSGEKERAFAATKQLVAQDLDREVAADALFLHVQTARAVGADAKAKEAVRQFLRRFPRSEHVQDARKLLRELRRA